METNISSAYENWAIFGRRKLLIVLELLHLKMEVTVSEPCDVIRVVEIEDRREQVGIKVFFTSHF